MGREIQTKTLWDAHSTQGRKGNVRFKQRRYGTPIQHRDVRAREIQTKTLWDAHSTQRHRGTETQREELNIELKKNKLLF
jgi:hypothetical protein